MPFTKHINWGPDKMDVAATGRNETRTPFAPEWVGAIMYGPLVMASPDIKEWKDADFSLSSDLREISLNGHTDDSGTNGNLYTLSLSGKHFHPDYFADRSTHYLRLHVDAGSNSSLSRHSSRGFSLGSQKGFSLGSLEQAITLAQERVEQQNLWNSLTVKVPAFAPWAPHGYSRLLTELSSAKQILARSKEKSDKSLTQENINHAASALNVAINTMRPGNLAETEDLADLLPLVGDTRNIADKSPELRNAISYADMVISYVNDGSGTHDLITKAIERLRKAMGK